MNHQHVRIAVATTAGKETASPYENEQAPRPTHEKPPKATKLATSTLCEYPVLRA